MLDQFIFMTPSVLKSVSFSALVLMAVSTLKPVFNPVLEFFFVLTTLGAFELVRTNGVVPLIERRHRVTPI